MAELSRDDVLPCDVLVAPGTIIRAGCNVSTLLLCLGNRVVREIAKLGPRGEVRAPQAVSVPEGIAKLANERQPSSHTTLDVVGVSGCKASVETAAPAAATREGKE